MHADHLPVGARGLSCQAYQGAAFWDQEVFNLPMWVHTFPEVARNLLVYRHRPSTARGARPPARLPGRLLRLDLRRHRRRAVPGLLLRRRADGAADPQPLQRLADAHLARHRGDDRRLRPGHRRRRLPCADHGAEIVFEVARFLASFVHFRPADGRYHLLRLLGPDEYHENVDDNVFTLEQSRVALAEACHALGRPRRPRARGPRPAAAGARARRARNGRCGSDVLAPRGDRARPRHGAARAVRRLLRPRGHRTRTSCVSASSIPTSTGAGPTASRCTPRSPSSRTSSSCSSTSRSATTGHGEANYDYYLPRTQHGSSLSRPMYALVAARLGRVARPSSCSCAAPRSTCSPTPTRPRAAPSSAASTSPPAVPPGRSPSSASVASTCARPRRGGAPPARGLGAAAVRARRARLLARGGRPPGQPHEVGVEVVDSRRPQDNPRTAGARGRAADRLGPARAGGPGGAGPCVPPGVRGDDPGLRDAGHLLA
jgi:hypothetical protein